MENLPNEVLYSIFEHLGYWELKLAIPAVCKHWKGLLSLRTETGVVDMTLFRDVPKTQEMKAGSFAAHPALKMLRFTMADNGANISIARRARSKFWFFRRGRSLDLANFLHL